MLRSLIAFLLLIAILNCTNSYVAVNENKQIVHGYVAPGFETVRDEFEKNLTQRKEIGAACAIYYQNEKVVDIWGGYRDKKKKLKWEENTLVSGWSSSKGAGAICLAKLHSMGLLDYDKKIIDYWPEFSKHNKADITVRQLLSQQAGLCLFNPEDAGRYTIKDLKNNDTLSRILENIIPLWEPGTKYGYHGGSEGLLIMELVRRIDPLHRTIGKFFQEEIAKPLNIEYYIGLPESIPQTRVAFMHSASPFIALFHLKEYAPGVRKALFNSKSIFMKSMTEVKGIDLNNREYLSFEDPDGNGVGEARALAALYNDLINGGNKIGIKEETIKLLEAKPSYPPDGKIDCVMGMPMPTVLGFMKSEQGGAQFTTTQRGYGFIGANGAIGCADPDRHLSFSYLSNHMGYHMSKHEDIILYKTWECIDNIETNKNGASKKQ
jgi:CubicO group peptidase (beta-lactamase class C family)